MKIGDDCNTCGMSYDACTDRIVKHKMPACCGRCGWTDTHNEQGAPPPPGPYDKWLPVAQAIGAMSRCDKRHVGAVILSSSNRVVSTGYNGAPAGYRLDTGETCSSWCPRAQNGTNTTDYDTCPSVHAEANALLYADRTMCEGGTIIVTTLPCINCAKLIANSGLVRVVFPAVQSQDMHRRPDIGMKLLTDSSVQIMMI